MANATQSTNTVTHSLPSKISVTPCSDRSQASERERGVPSTEYRQLRAKVARFEAVFATSPIGIAITDETGHLLEWNASFEAILERARLDPHGKNLLDLLHYDDRSALRSALDWIESGQVDDLTLDARLGHALANAHAQCSIAAVRNTDGHVDQFLALITDKTEEKRQEQQRAQIEAQLHQAQKLESIGQLAAGIAHEINTPTQYVTDNVGFLQKAFQKLFDALHACRTCVVQAQRDELDDATLRAASRALRAAKIDFIQAEIPKAIEQSLDGLSRVASIVRAMKEFSHPSQGNKTLVDLNQAVQATLTVAHNEWKYLANLETEFDTTLPPVPCIRDEFNQVVLNLIVNAAHAIGETVRDGKKGLIRVRTRATDTHFELQIADNGCGIPAEIQDRIFDPFFTTKEVGKGTGQGLAIAYQVIVEKHGGELSVDSKEGEGTTFTVRLPRSDPKERDAA